MSEATIYLHFSGKKELFIEILREARRLAINLVERTMELYDDPYQGVRKVVELHYHFINAQYPHLVKCMLIPIMTRDADMRAELQIYDKAIMELIARLLERAKEEGRVPEHLPVKGIGRVLVGLVVGMAVNLSLEYDYLTLEEYMESIDLLIKSVGMDGA